jgi:hypothetical protein
MAAHLAAGAGILWAVVLMTRRRGLANAGVWLLALAATAAAGYAALHMMAGA